MLSIISATIVIIAIWTSVCFLWTQFIRKTILYQIKMYLLRMIRRIFLQNHVTMFNTGNDDLSNIICHSKRKSNSNKQTYNDEQFDFAQIIFTKIHMDPYTEDILKLWVVRGAYILLFVIICGMMLGLFVITLYLKSQYYNYCKVLDSIFLYT